VRRVREAAHGAGLADADLVADTLVLAAATEEAGASATLDAIRIVADDLGLATLAGVSNVSHGLPGRPLLNARFLELAREAGLAAAIVNPLESAEPDAAMAAAATDVLVGRDVRAERWIALATAAAGAESAAQPPAGADEATRLGLAVERGDADSAPGLVDVLVAGGAGPQSVIADVLTPAIQRLGDAYGRGEAFLPQLIAAADAMKAAVERAKSYLPEGSAAHEGRVVFGTVKGDIHSIGKDICASMLESQGYLVEDLGVDVSPERFADAAREADAVCLSALMTTTLANMERTVAAVREAADVPVLVGGAVVTRDFADALGAGYSEDAPGCVSAVRSALATRKGTS
jgi:5-methyltetrahydrofolate--homocysteine methyltransferase